jgi:alkylation response protein AidB-like acyl-CoA dehydrogenase
MRTGKSSELEMLKGLAMDFAAGELVENREENDHYPFSPFFSKVVGKACEVGFFSLTLPEGLGGGGMGVEALAVVLDAVCQADASLGGIIFANALAQEICLQAGEGDSLAVPAGEPAVRDSLLAFPAYDDPRHTRAALDAVKKGKGYSLSGSIDYVALASLGSRALLPAGPGAAEGGSLFLAGLDDAGMSLSDPVFSLGLHACPACDLALRNVEARLVGEEGKGGDYFSAASGRMLAAAAALATGVLKGSVREALDYTRQRRQGGREIVNWSEVRMILANMAIAAQSADLLVEGACRAVDGQEPGWELYAGAAAIKAMDMACDATTDGIQLLGGNGYMVEYHQEKRFRDAKQIQALLGFAPMKKMEHVKRIIEEGLPW